MQKRRRFKQTTTLEQRLVAEANRVRSEAQTMPATAGRADLIKKLDRLDYAMRMNAWLNAPQAQDQHDR